MHSSRSSWTRILDWVRPTAGGRAAHIWSSGSLRIDLPVDVYFPIRVGLSLHNYYELAGVDHAFGFLSLGAHAEVPLVRTSNYGAWNVHGGIDFYSLGDTPEAFNGGDQTKVVASVGIGFTY